MSQNDEFILKPCYSSIFVNKFYVIIDTERSIDRGREGDKQGLDGHTRIQVVEMRDVKNIIYLIKIVLNSTNDTGQGVGKVWSKHLSRMVSYESS